MRCDGALQPSAERSCRHTQAKGCWLVRVVPPAVHPACHQGPLPPSPLMGIFPTAVESALKATLKSLFMYSGFSPSAW